MVVQQRTEGIGREGLSPEVPRETLRARPDGRLPRYAGAAFVLQFAASLAAGLLAASVLSGRTPAVLTHVAAHVGRMRAATVLELLTGLGIVALSCLLYVVLRDHGRPVATIALGCWLAEAVVLAVKALAMYALTLVSQGPVDPTGLRLGTVAHGVVDDAADVAMLFFCLGALGWYPLLLRARIVPRPLALWGLLATLPVLVATAMLVWDPSTEPAKAWYVAYVPFELVLGLWLLVRGAAVPTGTQPAGRRRATRVPRTPPAGRPVPR